MRKYRLRIELMFNYPFISERKYAWSCCIISLTCCGILVLILHWNFCINIYNYNLFTIYGIYNDNIYTLQYLLLQYCWFWNTCYIHFIKRIFPSFSVPKNNSDNFGFIFSLRFGSLWNSLPVVVVIIWWIALFSLLLPFKWSDFLSCQFWYSVFS